MKFAFVGGASRCLTELLNYIVYTFTLFRFGAEVDSPRPAAQVFVVLGFYGGRNSELHFLRIDVVQIISKKYIELVYFLHDTLTRSWSMCHQCLKFHFVVFCYETLFLRMSTVFCNRRLVMGFQIF